MITLTSSTFRTLLVRFVCVLLSVSIAFSQNIRADEDATVTQEISNAFKAQGLNYSVNYVDGKYVVAVTDQDNKVDTMAIEVTPAKDAKSEQKVEMTYTSRDFKVSQPLNDALKEIRKSLSNTQDPTPPEEKVEKIIEPTLKSFAAKVGRGAAWLGKSVTHNFLSVAGFLIVSWSLYRIPSILSGMYSNDSLTGFEVAKSGGMDLLTMISPISIYGFLLWAQFRLDSTSFYKNTPNLHRMAANAIASVAKKAGSGISKIRRGSGSADSCEDLFNSRAAEVQ